MTRVVPPSHLETPWTGAGEHRFALDSHRPLTISRSDQAFLVARGHVDLFAVMPPGDESPPRRWHLFRVANGGLILGLPASARDGRRLEVIAVGGLDAEVISCSRREVTDRAMLEKWSTLLLATVATLPGDIAASRIDPNVEGELAPGEMLRISGGQVSWLSVEEGAVAIVGVNQAITPIDPACPLSPGTCLVAERQTKLRGRDSALLTVAEVHAGLDVLHTLVVNALAHKFDMEWAADVARLQRRAVQEDLRV